MTKISHLRKRMRDEYKNRNLAEAAALGDALISEHWNTQAPGPGCADDIFNLALIYDELNQLDKAANLYSESAQFLPENDFVALAKRSNNLGGVLARMGAIEPAFHFYSQAKHIYRRFLGENHPAYADSLYNLANMAASVNYTKEAMGWHTEALEIREKAGASGDIVNSLHSLAFLYENAGDYKKAASFAETALEQVSDDNYASACNYLAQLYEADNESKKALALYNEVLGEISIAGCVRSDYLAILSRKAYLTGTTGDAAEALKLHEEVIRMYHNLTEMDLLGLDNLFYANCQRNMAILSNALGDTSKAEEYMLASLKARKEAGGELMPDICFLLRLYLKDDAYEKAMDMLIYALMHADSPNGLESDKTVDILMETFDKAGNAHQLLEAMKDINNTEKIQPILEKWQRQELL